MEKHWRYELLHSSLQFPLEPKAPTCCVNWMWSVSITATAVKWGSYHGGCDESQRQFPSQSRNYTSELLNVKVSIRKLCSTVVSVSIIVFQADVRVCKSQGLNLGPFSWRTSWPSQRNEFNVWGEWKKGERWKHVDMWETGERRDGKLFPSCATDGWLNNTTKISIKNQIGPRNTE